MFLLFKALAAFLTLLALAGGLTTEVVNEKAQDVPGEIPEALQQNRLQDSQKEHPGANHHAGRLSPLSDALLSPQPCMENFIRQNYVPNAKDPNGAFVAPLWVLCRVHHATSASYRC